MAMNDVECCDFYQVHENVAKAVNDKVPDEDELYDLAEIFKVLGDSTRIKILYVLSEAGVCVCDIAQLPNANQSAIPHQSGIPKQSRLVKNYRDGKTVLYPLADNYMRTIIDQGVEHIEEQTLRQIPMAQGWDTEYR